MSESTIYSHFCRKPRNVRDLRDVGADRPICVRVVKVIELTQEQYQHFCTHMLEDMPFIKANRTLTDRDANGVNHCLLVTARNTQGGILVDCQGYDYARYAAEVRDKSLLDLRDVSVDRCDIKQRQPRGQQER